MNDKIKCVLNKIEENNYEAFVVGGFVRDFLLGRNTNDVDICTNATPKELSEIFDTINIKEENYGSVRLKDDEFNYDITTYRSEVKYDNRRPVLMNYINDVEIDVKRRDFTINSLLMNSNGEIIDLVGGKDDVKKGIIKCVTSAKERFTEDPLRMLRAIRFATLLNFRISDETMEEILNNRELLRNISYNRMKDELDKILVSKNYMLGIALIKNFNLEDILGININEIKYTDDLCGMWSQIEFNDNYPFTKEEKHNIISIKEIISHGTIDTGILYKYDLYLSIVAGSILDIDKKTINVLYKSLPIKNIKELDISNDDIMNTLNIKPSKLLKSIMSILESKVLSGELLNKKVVLINYIIENGSELING